MCMEKDPQAAFYGDTGDDERQEIIRNFQNPNHKLRFFVQTLQQVDMELR